MGWWLTITSGVLLNIVAAGIYARGTRIGLWIAATMARLLPPEERDRYREEWRADILERSFGPIGGRDGQHHLGAFWWSLGTVRTAVLRSKARKRVPIWLLGHSDEALYRLSAGLIVGLSFGLTVGLIFGIRDGMSNGLAFGLGAALFAGLFVTTRAKLDNVMSMGLRGLLIVGMVVGLAHGSFQAVRSGLSDGLTYGLTMWLTYGVGMAPMTRTVQRFVVTHIRRLRARAGE